MSHKLDTLKKKIKKKIKNLLGAAVERTPKIEKVNLNGGRLIREAKVCLQIFNNKEITHKKCVLFIIIIFILKNILMIIIGRVHMKE